MPQQPTHTSGFMRLSTMRLFRILSHFDGIIFKALTPPPPADYQAVTLYLSGNYTSHNIGQTNIFLSFFYEKRQVFLLQ